MRMFLSINLSKEIVAELSRLQHAIRSNLSPVDKLLLVKPESIHLTLKFFADVDKSKLPQILDAFFYFVDKGAPFFRV